MKHALSGIFIVTLAVSSTAAHAKPRFVRLRQEIADAALIGRVKITGYDSRGAPCWEVLEPLNAPVRSGCAAIQPPKGTIATFSESTLTGLWPPLGWEGLVISKEDGEVSLFASEEKTKWRLWSPHNTESIALFDCQPPARPLPSNADNRKEMANKSWDGCLVDKSILALRFHGSDAKSTHDGPPETGDYISATFFKRLAALVPELQRPRLISLSEDGQRAWEADEMRVHGTGSLVYGDFNLDGQRDVAILLTDGRNHGVLVASESSGQWKRAAFLPVDGQATVAFENGMGKLGPSKRLLVWDGRAYSLESPLDILALAAAASDFVLKVTYVGAQEGMLPGLLLASYNGLPDVALFRRWRTSGINYVNDEAGVLFTITASDEALRIVAEDLEHWPGLYRAKKRSSKAVESAGALYSLSVGRRSGNAFKTRPIELFLSLDEAQQLFKMIADRLQKENPGGAEQIRQMR